MTVNLYLDMEFTGLYQHTTPISLALVRDDGGFFYAEFNDYDRSQVDAWIKENVLDNLYGDYPFYHGPAINGGRDTMLLGQSTEEIAADLRTWLEAQGPVQVVGDMLAYDWVLFCQLFGGALHLPDNVSPAPLDVNQLIARYEGLSDADASYIPREKFADLEYGGKHNALWDARVTQACYLKAVSYAGCLAHYSLVDGEGNELGCAYYPPIEFEVMQWIKKESSE